jgi:hypothetical protein
MDSAHRLLSPSRKECKAKAGDCLSVSLAILASLRESLPPPGSPEAKMKGKPRPRNR